MICTACQLVEVDDKDGVRQICRMCEQMELAVQIPIDDNWFWVEPADEYRRWFRKVLGMDEETQ